MPRRRPIQFRSYYSPHRTSSGPDGPHRTSSNLIGDRTITSSDFVLPHQNRRF